jgi:hypothetical protein
MRSQKEPEEKLDEEQEEEFTLRRQELRSRYVSCSSFNIPDFQTVYEVEERIHQVHSHCINTKEEQTELRTKADERRRNQVS